MKVSNIISCFNLAKDDGTSSIPTRILKLLHKGILDQMANNQSTSGISPSLLKTSKIMAINIKGSKQNVKTTDRFLYYVTLIKSWKG